MATPGARTGASVAFAMKLAEPKRLATDTDLSGGVAILRDAAEAQQSRVAIRDRFQDYVGSTGRDIQDPRWEILATLAYDLEYYAVDPTVDGPPFYGDAEFDRRVKSALDELARSA